VEQVAAIPPPAGEPEKAETEDLQIEEPWVEGVLHDADGVPLAGVRVRISGPPVYRKLPVKKSGDGWSTPAVKFEDRPGFSNVRVFDRVFSLGDSWVVTDENGRFGLPPPPAEGRYSLLVHALGAALSPARILHRIDGVERLSGRVVHLGVVCLPRPGTISGTVVDEDGTPVGSHRVWRIATDFGVNMSELAKREGGPVSQSNLLRSPPTALPGTFTDAAGRFLLEDVPPGPYIVFAGSPLTARAVTVADGEEAPPVRLVVAAPRPPYISGRVIDADTGLPIKARISYGFRFKRGGGIGAARWTAADGTFLLHSLKPGSYTLKIQAEGHEPATWGPHLIAADERKRSVEVILQRE